MSYSDSDDWELVEEPAHEPVQAPPQAAPPVYEVIDDLAPPFPEATLGRTPAPVELREAPFYSTLVPGPQRKCGWLVQQVAERPSATSVSESFAVWDFGDVPPGVHCGPSGTYGGLRLLAGHEYKCGRDRLRGKPTTSAARYNPQEAAYVWQRQEEDETHRTAIPRFYLWSRK